MNEELAEIIAEEDGDDIQLEPVANPKQAETIRQLRNAGIPVRGRRFDHQIGWTTDEAVAEKAREPGAVVIVAHPLYVGWEISVPPDSLEGQAEMGEWAQ